MSASSWDQSLFDLIELMKSDTVLRSTTKAPFTPAITTSPSGSLTTLGSQIFLRSLIVVASRLSMNTFIIGDSPIPWNPLVIFSLERDARKGIMRHARVAKGSWARRERLQLGSVGLRPARSSSTRSISSGLYLQWD